MQTRQEFYREKSITKVLSSTTSKYGSLCMAQAMTAAHDPPPTPSRMQVLAPAATFHALRQGREHQARLQLRDRLLSRPKNTRGQKQYLRSDNMCSVLSYFPIVILLAFAFSLALQIAWPAHPTAPLAPSPRPAPPTPRLSFHASGRACL